MSNFGKVSNTPEISLKKVELVGGSSHWQYTNGYLNCPLWFHSGYMDVSHSYVCVYNVALDLVHRPRYNDQLSIQY